MVNKYKILLVQLPNPEFKVYKNWGNLPLAAGYLKAMAHHEGLLELAEIEILNPKEADLAGDARLIDMIVEKKPDLLGFSLYLWNAKRSLHIAHEIKRKLPNIRIIVGGPEVTLEADYILNNKAIDIGCFRDGELTFCEIVKTSLDKSKDWSKIKGIFYRESGKVHFTPQREYLQNLNIIPSPFSLKYFDLKNYSAISYETLRGCPCQCTYCNWATVPLRYFSADRVIKDLTQIIHSGAKIIRFIESSPLIHPEFTKIFQELKKANKNKKIKFAAFSSFLQLNEEKVRLLKECNFNFLEIGLQTTNPKTLKILHRPPLNKERFINGIRLLEKHGIDYTIDTMLGLPGETYQDYEETVRFITDNKFRSFSTFPLMLMPETRIRKTAEELGIRYQKKIPYYIIDTKNISSAKIKAASKLNTAKDADEMIFLKSYDSHFITQTSLSAPDEKIKSLVCGIHKIKLSLNGCETTAEKTMTTVSNLKNKINYPFTVWCTMDDLVNQYSSVEFLLIQLLKANPFVLFTFIVEFKKPRISNTSYDVLNLLNDVIQTKERCLSSSRAKKTLRKFMLLPWEECDHFDIAGITKKVKNFKVTAKIKISKKNDWQKKLNVFFAKSSIPNILIELDTDSDIMLVLDLFDFLFLSNHHNYYFENIVLYYLFEVYKSSRLGIQDYFHLPKEDSIVSIDENFTIHPEFFMDKTSKLHLTGLQMKFFKLVDQRKKSGRYQI